MSTTEAIHAECAMLLDGDETKLEHQETSSNSSRCYSYYDGCAVRKIGLEELSDSPLAVQRFPTARSVVAVVENVAIATFEDEIQNQRFSGQNGPSNGELLREEEEEPYKEDDTPLAVQRFPTARSVVAVVENVANATFEDEIQNQRFSGQNGPSNGELLREEEEEPYKEDDNHLTLKDCSVGATTDSPATSHPNALSSSMTATYDEMLARQAAGVRDNDIQCIQFSKQKHNGSDDRESCENDGQLRTNNGLLLDANSELQGRLDSMQNMLVLEQYYSSQLEEKIAELEAKLNQRNAIDSTSANTEDLVSNTSAHKEINHDPVEEPCGKTGVVLLSQNGLDSSPSSKHVPGIRRPKKGKSKRRRKKGTAEYKRSHSLGDLCKSIDEEERDFFPDGDGFCNASLDFLVSSKSELDILEFEKNVVINQKPRKRRSSMETTPEDDCLDEFRPMISSSHDIASSSNHSTSKKDESTKNETGKEKGLQGRFLGDAMDQDGYDDFELHLPGEKYLVDGRSILTRSSRSRSSGSLEKLGKRRDVSIVAGDSFRFWSLEPDEPDKPKWRGKRSDFQRGSSEGDLLAAGLRRKKKTTEKKKKSKSKEKKPKRAYSAEDVIKDAKRGNIEDGPWPAPNNQPCISIRI
jgi:hypothetical protein